MFKLLISDVTLWYCLTQHRLYLHLNFSIWHIYIHIYRENGHVTYFICWLKKESFESSWLTNKLTQWHIHTFIFKFNRCPTTTTTHDWTPLFFKNTNKYLMYIYIDIISTNQIDVCMISEWRMTDHAPLLTVCYTSSHYIVLRTISSLLFSSLSIPPAVPLTHSPTL